ncbi:hypothetical protein Gasu2_04030 [Galdieria sulphuraria]|uniref:Uncharacterized protein n=1 Tax=Galdieria sulphuraria TaxID=130081 RepID=M2Y0R3_GALSU|nr:uncharacterized protein Gasu_31550 [Galdieria sulphuraria]EME29518.1 hypothetical protein Gasu_31550 [Galdieria sulphuraria]GJD05961.1 hypothetical protein Gasu2_04030 [Galdieria sulphuraria]|eukprot:XP_005706038.1 hypothetical protein Gasu_31550 [Galdieria sulphuraria]
MMAINPRKFQIVGNMQMVFTVDEESGKDAYVLSALTKLPDNPFVALSALHFLQHDPLTTRLALQRLVQSIDPNTEKGVQDLSWLTEHHLVDLLANILADYGTSNENIACSVCAIVFDISGQPKGRSELIKFGIIPKIIESARTFPRQRKLVYFVCGALGNLLWEKKTRDIVLMKEIVNFLMASIVNNETEERIVREGIRGLYNACYVEETAEMLSSARSWMEKLENIMNNLTDRNSTAHLFFQKLEQKLETSQEDNLVKKISWVSVTSEQEEVAGSAAVESQETEDCSFSQVDNSPRKCLNNNKEEWNSISQGCSTLPSYAMLSVVLGGLLLSAFAYYRWH